MNSIPPSKRQPAGDAFRSIQRSRERRRSEGGVALLIVLGMLILLSIIVIAFVMGVTNELDNSTGYAKETSTLMLSDSVLSIVETQIREASTSPGEAWISQPGLLRTFDTSGNPVAAYKLYSAPQMVVAGAFDPNADADLPSDNSWLNQPNLYTDINSPVASGTTTTGSTNYIFPIIDGNGIQQINISGSSQFAYTTDGTIPSIEGFGTDPAKVGINYNASTALSATNNPVPMPLHWLYMLKDGSLIPATAVANSRDVVFTGTLVPTETNPVIARVAFWGDDDTCKLNVNTSSEGTFSDDPVGNTQPFYNQATAAGDPDPQGSSVFDPNQIFEWDLAQRQPDRNEYQRYPGHPAENCLSVVFGDTVWRGLNLGTGTSSTGYATDYGYHTLTGSSYARFVEFYNQMAPRISGMDATSTSYTAGTDNSSRAGTTRPGGTSLYSGGISSTEGNGAAIVVDQDRLYATVGEYIYSATAPAGTAMRLPNGEFLTGSVSTGGTSVPVISAAFAAKTNFFLSANSSAPELNVFNMPRVCIWPITKTASTLDNPDTSNPAVTATMTAFDKVMAFVCTVGTGTSTALSQKIPFYFSRYDAYNQANDYAKSANNQNLYAYLHGLLARPFPGLSASANATFVNKYPAEDTGGANQILTEIYDYIRCTNLADCSEDVPGQPPFGAKSYTMMNPSYQWTDAPWNGLSSQGEVVPIVIGNTRGIGRIPFPGEMTLIMVKEDARMNSAVAENVLQNSITVASGPYQGTWNFVHPQPNLNNMLPGETTPLTVYQKPYPNGETPPTQDYLLLPGAGGFSVASTNKYDPRSQTKVQVVLAPYYFCPMAGFSAIGANLRLHWSNTAISLVGTGTGAAVSGTVAVMPGPNGVFPNGTQGQDLYESGRIGVINQMEIKIGGPMGPKTCIDPTVSVTIPTNIGAPVDSMFQTGEVIVKGTSSPGATFSGTSPNTMVLSGSATLQIMAPATPLVWAARGINDQPAVIQTINYSWPQTTVQIPSLNQNAGPTFPFVNLQSGTSTLSGNAATAESMFISSTSSGGQSVKGGVSRMSGWPNNYATNLLYPNFTMYDTVRSLQASGTLNGNTPLAGDLRLVAATGTVPSAWFQPIQKYPANGTFIPICNGGGFNWTGNYTSGSLTPYFDTTQQYQFGWRTSIFYQHWHTATPPGNLFGNYSGNTFTSPQYADNEYSAYLPGGVCGVYNSLGATGDVDNGQGWLSDGAYCNKPDEGWIRHYEAQQNFVASSIAPFIGHAFDSEDAALGLASLYSPNRMVSSPVMFGSLPTGVLAGHPWQTLKFSPAKPYFPGGSYGALSGNPVHPGAGVGASGGQSPGMGVLPYGPYSMLPDHAILDLFWMPVVDPYPISEPFATAGKVNLNYQIAPFTYIKRETALRGVLQSVKITALNPTSTDNLPNEMPGSNTYGNPYTPANAPFSMTYKIPGSYLNKDDTTGGVGYGGGLGVCVRRNIDIDDTLKQIDYLRFGVPGASVNKPFITASEICDVPLIPADLPNCGVTQPYNINAQIRAAAPSGYDSILASFWYGNDGKGPQFGHRLTGDNSLERPYSMIYPRLTTKSNTYTIHMRVQTLKKAAGTPAAMFKDGQDQVTGEYRGSFVLERYLDPATTGFYKNGNPGQPTTMNDPGAQLGPYKFRVVSSKQFAQ